MDVIVMSEKKLADHEKPDALDGVQETLDKISTA